MTLTKYKKPDTGLLIMRIGLGITFIIFGIKKLMSGAESLESLGGAMKIFGIAFFPLFFGILGALGEAIGGLLILIGYKYRFGALLLFFVMMVAFFARFEDMPSILKNAWSLQLITVFLGLAFIGPGKYSLDKE